ncbi:MAG: hypothetical protein A2653_03175 [Candidatus Zambryskibacteria bacterium RIFCSPHIGHO2_01_FULL_43_25]|uniref:Transglutaminase-like domain-containing protein n=1 Tax=Candidatus Zambryskibacteria bacterium RIFCSPLOWO2_01_FULL_45_21 TaxID=1802761 RepID=A0A1G2U446_9BACT|nr:MAG: hypothetical protein A2653_03175 [Candidatus Zambryskibacteria bacterium RIFCSPHIGHO2_01_FULL_43_25]OHB00974.1 MAG: hypothetical protein A3E94_02170 [Candidatus Zambryskibacteria bacterium RIFCSPHIGHO2_12_FULL_44_12b]OHB03690.1 MAG: hypothetical protein A3B14_01445 [Candidatus Zambryskibacteria bacterium RIFCSPLOWO2_01_FULL_45_21]
MRRFFNELTAKEKRIFEKLDTPRKIQDFLEKIPINFAGENGKPLSPRKVLQVNRMHCFEGALFAAAALLYHGEPAILLDLKTTSEDDSHVVALYKEHGKWGAISKTNHAVLRFRDPVYLSPRELAMSYFHEYFLDDGRKTLRSYAVFNLNKIKRNWIIDEKLLIYIDKALNKVKRFQIVSAREARNLRLADSAERKAGKITVYENGGSK